MISFGFVADGGKLRQNEIQLLAGKRFRDSLQPTLNRGNEGTLTVEAFQRKKPGIQVSENYVKNRGKKKQCITSEYTKRLQKRIAISTKLPNIHSSSMTQLQHFAADCANSVAGARPLRCRTPTLYCNTIDFCTNGSSVRRSKKYPGKRDFVNSGDDCDGGRKRVFVKIW